jgi:hypothetical protein
MNEAYKLGDLVKTGNKVFEINGITEGSAIIPAGWLIDKSGSFINPMFCSKYKGATSCFDNPEKDNDQ